jgi:hypothetical protein
MSTHRGPRATKYSVDISYLVADLKYSAKNGVKICEVQQASLSLFNGDAFRNAEEKSIHKELLHALSLYNANGWVVSEGIADKNLVSALTVSSSWRNPKDMIDLFSDRSFKDQYKQAPKDRYDLSSYQGLLYISWSQLSAIYDFEERMPGMVVIDKSSFPLWIDKQRMTRLFNEDKILSTFKPKWGSYQKKYTKGLAAKIADDLQCDTFVIKPRGNFMGRGVIITPLKDLDETLHYIVTKKGALAESKDQAYTAWQRDTHDSFIVEEFVASDPIQLPHLDNKTYQPTMRVAFLLVYNNRRHHIHFLGEYWKTPEVSIDDKGSFMEKNKDICESPYYLAVDAETKQAVHDKLSIALPILHHKMLLFQPDNQEPLYIPVRNGVQLAFKEVAPIH